MHHLPVAGRKCDRHSPSDVIRVNWVRRDMEWELTTHERMHPGSDCRGRVVLGAKRLHIGRGRATVSVCVKGVVAARSQ